MSEAAKQVVDKLTEGLLVKFNVTAELVRSEQQDIDPDELRELIAKRPEEPEPVGHEHFEHLREEGA